MKCFIEIPAELVSGIWMLGSVFVYRPNRALRLNKNAGECQWELGEAVVLLSSVWLRYLAKFDRST